MNLKTAAEKALELDAALPAPKMTLEEIRQALTGRDISPLLEWNLPGILLAVLNHWEAEIPGVLREVDIDLKLAEKRAKIITHITS